VERPRRHEQKSLLNAGAALTEPEAIELAISLDHNPNDVQTRFKLAGFYINKMYSESRVDPVLFEQLQWLMQSIPDLPLFSSVEAAYGCLDRDQFFSMYKTLLDTLDLHEHTIELLINAKRFLHDCKRDPELEDRLSAELDALRRVQ